MGIFLSEINSVLAENVYAKLIRDGGFAIQKNMSHVQENGTKKIQKDAEKMNVIIEGKIGKK